MGRRKEPYKMANSKSKKSKGSPELKKALDILAKQGKKTKVKKKDRIDSSPAHSHDRVREADGSINVSQSKVKSWRHCHRQYHNRYVLGLQKKKIKRPFMFGTIIHNMAEADFEGKDPMKVLDAIELEACEAAV